MKQNDGDKEDAPLYTDILGIYQEASDAKIAEKWDVVIEKSETVTEKVLQLLTSFEEPYGKND